MTIFGPIRLSFYLLNIFAIGSLSVPVASLTVGLPSSNVSSNNKAGLGWGAGPDVSVSQYTSTGKVSWYYDWSPQSYLKGLDLEFTPMLWGAKDLSQWNSTINETITNYPVTAVLGMNERVNTPSPSLINCSLTCI